MLVDDDPGARRNHGDSKGLWVINALVCTLVAVLSLYVLRPDDTRQEARSAIAAVESLPAQITSTPAIAAARD